MSTIAIWKWRYADYTNEELSEIYRRDKPGEEGASALAAMEVLAERAKSAGAPRIALRTSGPETAA